MSTSSNLPSTLEQISREYPAPRGTYYHLEEIGAQHVEVQLRSKRRLLPLPKLIDYVVYSHGGAPEQAIAASMRILARDNRR